MKTPHGPVGADAKAVEMRETLLSLKRHACFPLALPVHGKHQQEWQGFGKRPQRGNLGGFQQSHSGIFKTN